MLAQMPDRLRDALRISGLEEMTEPRTLASCHESVDDLLHNERSQNVTALRLLYESNESHDSIEKIRVDRIHIHCFSARLPFLDLDVGFQHDRGNQRRIKVKA